ncbi:MAG: glutamate-5-semialdehyde dehydrogenase [Oscillatoriales cyanobacterium SM2_2_1]|nr:glutamate-5-semialdehyde dehydrogenase [Oscillatoriales cyanobacterium SM2_2_1]
MSTDQADQRQSLPGLVAETRVAAKLLARLEATARNNALEAIAQAIETHVEEILAANAVDVTEAIAQALPTALVRRLKLDRHKVRDMAAGVRDVARLIDPIGVRHVRRRLAEDLVLERVTCPLGVLGVIFESRPDAVPQIVSLAVKSGNGVLLKGGTEALHSCTVLVEVIQSALMATVVPPAMVQLLTTRAEITELLGMEGNIDLIIPRGSNQFVRFIQERTRIPVLGHADGLCHLYVDRELPGEADLDMAVAIAVDSKTQYPAACNAIETLLVHRDIAPDFLPRVAAALTEQSVALRGCDRTRELVPSVVAATEADWATEYCDLVLAIRVVADLEAAITHINTYGSRHTEVIVTRDAQAAVQFRQDVNAAGVYTNCSSRFADGYRYGFGAEVGISTQVMPPRGPVGVEGLVTYKYHLVGNGAIIASFTGAAAQQFLHQDF